MEKIIPINKRIKAPDISEIRSGLFSTEMTSSGLIMLQNFLLAEYFSFQAGIIPASNIVNILKEAQTYCTHFE